MQYVVPVKKIPLDIFCQNQMVGSLILYVLNAPADVILKTNGRSLTNHSIFTFENISFVSATREHFYLQNLAPMIEICLFVDIKVWKLWNFLINSKGGKRESRFGYLFSLGWSHKCLAGVY